jgi:hypothetical protein
VAAAIGGEVTPQPGQVRRAAAALQEYGFRVLHLGATISVEAPEAVWVQAFGDTMEDIPESLHELVADAAPAVPPDFH